MVAAPDRPDHGRRLYSKFYIVSKVLTFDVHLIRLHVEPEVGCMSGLTIYSVIFVSYSCNCHNYDG
jgi:hypothetical protein